MRLRTRLALAFSVLAVLPLSLVVPTALRNLRTTLGDELETRIRAEVGVAEAELERTSQDILRAVDDLVESPAVEQVARSLEDPAAAPERKALAGQLMRERALSVLSLLDNRGVTLSSGHLPARLGDVDALLFAVTQKPGTPVATFVELRNEQGVLRAPALLTARPFDYGDVRLWIVGGTLLDQTLAVRLSRLTGALVSITSEGKQIAQAGNAQPPHKERTLELLPAARFTLSFSLAALLEAERGLREAFAAVVALGLLLAGVLGFFVARRITRPVEALTEGARKVAQGALDTRIEGTATGEVGELLETFNKMTSELHHKTHALVASERVAAWQEIARRLAHELKNPLTPIQMSLETLRAAQAQKSPRFSALFEESAGPMLEEVARLRRTVDEFSRFARLPKPVLEPLNLTELVAQVLTLYSTAPRHVALVSELKEAVPVEADRDQVTQVLTNLLKNAEEALEAGGTIWVRTLEREGEAILEVEDSGKGIPADEVARVLEPYFTTKAGGTGLGLAIASRICEEHGGRLELSSAEGKGAVFRMVLPSRQNAKE